MRRTRGETFVYVFLPRMVLLLNFYWLAATLEGTVIAGSRSTHDNNKKWDEKDVRYVHRLFFQML